MYSQNERRRLNQALGCGLTLYGWDQDVLAWESQAEQTTHYIHEPSSFVPLAQAISQQAIRLHDQPVYGSYYDIDEDPLWAKEFTPNPISQWAYYQCDHLGTPQELTDQAGELAWSAEYKAWGQAKEVISRAAQSAGDKFTSVCAQSGGVD